MHFAHRKYVAQSIAHPLALPRMCAANLKCGARESWQFSVTYENQTDTDHEEGNFIVCRSPMAISSTRYYKHTAIKDSCPTQWRFNVSYHRVVLCFILCALFHRSFLHQLHTMDSPPLLPSITIFPDSTVVFPNRLSDNHISQSVPVLIDSSHHYLYMPLTTREKAFTPPLPSLTSQYQPLSPVTTYQHMRGTTSVHSLQHPTTSVLSLPHPTTSVHSLPHPTTSTSSHGMVSTPSTADFTSGGNSKINALMPTKVYCYIRLVSLCMYIHFILPPETSVQRASRSTTTSNSAILYSIIC